MKGCLSGRKQDDQLRKANECHEVKYFEARFSKVLAPLIIRAKHAFLGSPVTGSSLARMRMFPGAQYSRARTLRSLRPRMVSVLQEAKGKRLGRDSANLNAF